MRSNGFIVLDKLDNLIIEDVSLNHAIMYLNINGERYVFKSTPNCYNEVFTSICAEELGIYCLKYDLAQFRGIKGVISRNYKIEGAKYVSGYEILEKFYEDSKEFLKEYGILNISKDKETNISLVMNNLEIIWLSLLNYYKGNNNLNIKLLMEQIVDLFIFSLLCNEFDRHAENWEIEECSGYINLAPIFDNEMSFSYADESLSFHVSVEDYEKNPYISTLREFLYKSDGVFKDRFMELYDKLYGEDIFDKIIDIFERRIETKLPKDERHILERAYYVIRDYIESEISHKTFN